MKPDWFLDSEKSVMKSRFILFIRAGVYYSEDTVTRKQHSLRTKDKASRDPAFRKQSPPPARPEPAYCPDVFGGHQPRSCQAHLVDRDGQIDQDRQHSSPARNSNDRQGS